MGEGKRGEVIPMQEEQNPSKVQTVMYLASVTKIHVGKFGGAGA